MPNMTYHVRAYAMNSQGISYGNDDTFVTMAGVPSVTTKEPSNVTSNGADLGGNVSDNGGATITERGVCWSINPNPDISGEHQPTPGGLGDFSIQVRGLAPGTTYYVCAYATNEAGTGYGTKKPFTP